MEFNADQLEVIKQLVQQMTEETINTNLASLRNEFSTELNKSLNGFGAKVSKQLDSLKETKVVDKNDNSNDSNLSERVTLKKLQAELQAVRDELAQSKQQAITATKKAALAKHAGKALDAEAFTILFEATYGEYIKVLEDGSVLIQKGDDDVITLDDAINEFTSSGKGAFLMPPTIEVEKVSNVQGSDADNTVASEQELLNGFLDAFSKPFGL